MRRIAVWICGAVLLASGCRWSRNAPGPVVLTVTAVLDNEYLEAERTSCEAFTRDTGIVVRILPTLESSTDRLQQYRNFLNKRSPSPDVLALDVVWPGLLADHLVDLKGAIGVERQDQFPELMANATVRGRLVGLPVTADAGLLYYRTDLLKAYGFGGPPRTFAELEQMARVIQAGERAKGHGAFWGYVWQGAQYEALTCNALEWQNAAGGGGLVEPDGTIHVNNSRAIAALERAAGWVGTISPQGVLEYKEEDTINVWERGNAAFMRNWSYGFTSGQTPSSPVYGRFGVVRIPGGGVLGGAALGVSAYSQHRREAIEFVKYYANRESQRDRALLRFCLPSIASLYDDPAIRGLPVFAVAADRRIMEHSQARPSGITGEKYDRVSRAYFTAVHSVLAREQSAAAAMAGLERDLTEVMRSAR